MRGSNLIWTIVGVLLIIALVIFLAVKAINSLRRKEAEAPSTPAPTRTEALLEDIRRVREELLGEDD